MSDIQRREESVQVIYVNNQPEFIVKANGTLNWFRLSKASQQDLLETIDQKKEVINQQEDV